MEITEQAIEACTKAIQRIEEYPTSYRFGDWGHCACGHIYRAVEGRYAKSSADVCEYRRDTAYAKVIREIALALGGHSGDYSPHMHVSAKVTPDGYATETQEAKAVRVLGEARSVLEHELAAERDAAELAEYEAAQAQTKRTPPTRRPAKKATATPAKTVAA
jgi:hypothetical protein